MDEKMVQLFGGGGMWDVGCGWVNIKYLSIVIIYMKRKYSKKNKLVTRRRVIHGGMFGFVERSDKYKTLLDEKIRLEKENIRLEKENKILEKTNNLLSIKKNAEVLSFDTSTPQKKQSTIVTFDFELLKKINDFPFLKIEDSYESVEGDLKTYTRENQARDSTPVEQKIYKLFISGEFKTNTTVTVVNSECKIVGFVECPNENPRELLYLDIKSASNVDYVVLTKPRDSINVRIYYFGSDGIISPTGFKSLE